MVAYKHALLNPISFAEDLNGKINTVQYTSRIIIYQPIQLYSGKVSKKINEGCKICIVQWW